MAQAGKSSKVIRAGTTLDTYAPAIWSSEALRHYMSTNAGQGNEGLFREVYDWNREEYVAALQFVTQELEKHDWGSRFPGVGNKRYNERQDVERTCVNSQHELFCRRQDAPASERPSWFYPELYINGRGMVSQKDKDVGFTIGYLFVAHCYSKLRKSDIAAKAEDEEAQRQAKRRSKKSPRAHSTSSVGSHSSTAGLTKRRKRQRLSASATSTPNERSRSAIDVDGDDDDDDDDDDKAMFEAQPEKPALQDCFLIIANVTSSGSNQAAIALRRPIGSELFGDDRRVLKDEIRLFIPCDDKGTRLFYCLSTEVFQEVCDAHGFATVALTLWQRLSDPSFITLFVSTDATLVERLPRKYHDLRWQKSLNIQCDLAEPDSDSLPAETEHPLVSSPARESLPPSPSRRTPSPSAESEEERLERADSDSLLSAVNEEFIEGCIAVKREAES